MRRVFLVIFASVLVSTTLLAQTATQLASQAEAAYRQKQFARSADLYSQAIAQGEDDPATFYNAACSHALSGDTEKALKFLLSAIDHGYYNVEHLKQDTDLGSLRSDPRWQKVMDAAASRARTETLRWNSPALKTPYRENISEEEKLAGLSRFWSEARYNFANFDLVSDLDWDALYLSYIPKVRATSSTYEYYRVLQEMCARLKDGHTDIIPPREVRPAAPAIETRYIDGHPLVLNVYDEALKNSGIVRGMEIVAIDGTPVKQYAEEKVAPYQSASTSQDRDSRTYERALFAGPATQPIEVTLRDANGHTLTQRMTRLPMEERRKLMGRREFEFKMLPGNIAYVALNTFLSDVAPKEFEKAFDEIAKSDALIIDIRENGGGNSNNGYRVLSMLTDQPFKTSRWRTREYRPSYRAWGRPERTFGSEAEPIAPDGKHFYARPVIVLTSARTFSAAEDFAVAFDAMKRGTIIGEPTGGSTGQPLMFDLPGGGSARVCSKRDTYPDGREFIGIGIQPAKIVRPTVEDFRAGRDIVLNAALEELKKTAVVKKVAAK